MKKLVLWLICVGLLTAACAPDLVVPTLETNGSAEVIDGSAVIPIRVVVKNQGSGSAAIFKVAAEYTGPDGTFVVAFTVPGKDPWYPFTGATLGAGKQETFDGTLTFHPSVHGVTVSVKAIADSCSGDEFMPDYCRVDESNEANNESAALSLTVP